jgi:hypothetical protein
MTDEFTKVATYNQSFEAQLAKNLLENEGIPAILSGELTSDVLFSNAGLGDQIVLKVRHADAQRAAGILATVAAAKLDENWEEQAESGVWICAICGEPIHNMLSVCYSCQTPREGIRASAPRDNTAIQHDPSALPTGEAVQKRDEIARAPGPAATPLPSPTTTDAEASYEPPSPTLPGDILARRAFFAAMIGAATVCFLPLSWYFLLEAVSFDGPRSPRGNRHLYGALAINALCLLVPLLLCIGLRA